MSGEATSDLPSAPPATWPMFRALVGTGVLCSLLIVTVYELTRPVIAANQQRALAAAIFDVLPGATSTRALSWRPETGFAAVGAAADSGATSDSGGDSDGPVVYAAYGEGGRLIGFAVEAQGMGYADIIRVLYGYDPHRQAIVGLRVLESRETPGLGDKIETDPAFVANFAALDVSLNADGTDLANPIEATKHGDKTNRWQVDAITGATISSFAIADILGDSATTWVPHLARVSRTLTADRASSEPTTATGRP